jgi:hypothetical protein
MLLFSLPLPGGADDELQVVVARLPAGEFPDPAAVGGAIPNPGESGSCSQNSQMLPCRVFLPYTSGKNKDKIAVRRTFRRHIRIRRGFPSGLQMRPADMLWGKWFRYFLIPVKSK